MQLLHGVYNLQKNHERNEWKSIWKIAANECGVDNIENPSKIIPQPVLTRWWTVGVAAAFLVKNKDTIHAVCNGVINNTKLDNKNNSIASGVWALIKTAQVINDVHIINAYHQYFLGSHFAWLQKGDPYLGNKPGYLNQHIAV